MSEGASEPGGHHFPSSYLPPLPAPQPTVLPHRPTPKQSGFEWEYFTVVPTVVTKTVVKNDGVGNCLVKKLYLFGFYETKKCGILTLTSFRPSYSFYLNKCGFR